ncbi:MAG: DUF6107 family protein [Pseudomonadota bacterium]
MSDFSNAAIIWAAKGAGAVAGSLISIAYVLPRGRREAALRATVGVTTGMVFGGPAGLMLTDHAGIAGRLGAAETALIGAATASLIAWWGLGFLSRLINRPLGQHRLTHESGKPPIKESNA